MSSVDIKWIWELYPSASCRKYILKFKILIQNDTICFHYADSFWFLIALIALDRLFRENLNLLGWDLSGKKKKATANICWYKDMIVLFAHRDARSRVCLSCMLEWKSHLKSKWCFHTFWYAGKGLVLLKSDCVEVPCNLIFQNVFNYQLC